MFFFFQQKAAYEVLRGLVGSEVCIRGRYFVLSAEVCRISLTPINCGLSSRITHEFGESETSQSVNAYSASSTAPNTHRTLPTKKEVKTSGVPAHLKKKLNIKTVTYKPHIKQTSNI